MVLQPHNPWKTVGRTEHRTWNLPHLPQNRMLESGPGGYNCFVQRLHKSPPWLILSMMSSSSHSLHDVFLFPRVRSGSCRQFSQDRPNYVSSAPLQIIGLFSHSPTGGKVQGISQKEYIWATHEICHCGQIQSASDVYLWTPSNTLMTVPGFWRRLQVAAGILRTKGGHPSSHSKQVFFSPPQGSLSVLHMEI